MKQKFEIQGMTCSACSSHVEKAVAKIDNVTNVSVNLLTNSMLVEYNEPLTQADIIKAVVDSGYGASYDANKLKGEKNNQQNADLPRQAEKNTKNRLIISFAFLIPLMYVSMGHMAGLPVPSFLSGMQNAVSFAFTQLLLTLPIIYVNRSYFEKGFKTLFKGAPNMDSLIAIGSGAALVYGIYAIYQIGYGLGHNDMAIVGTFHMDLYFESAATILTLITLGKYLEAKSKGKTSEALNKLIDLAPKTASVIRDGVESEIAVEDIVKGDIIAVRPGQSVPVDGVITKGASSIDESAITGESVPSEKTAGDRVIGATINKSGYFEFKATEVGEDTTLAQIIHLVEDASATKAPIAKLADKVAGVFVPVVISIAIIATLIWLLMGYGISFALSIGISVLVISCPCALGLATPVAIMAGTGKGAENGILIKSSAALETAHKVNAVVLDKTGTITEGTPRVTDIIANNIDENKLVEIAAAIEKQSEHPLAQAIVSYAKQNKTAQLNCTDFNAIFGKGVIAQIDNEIYYGGNALLLSENGITNTMEAKGIELSENGKTPLYFASSEGILGIIAVADTIKSTSRQAIELFEQNGIEVTMLTGDNQRTADAIGRQLGIENVIAGVLPQNKESYVKKLQEQGKTVAMVGDGINDAPALTRADVGIAIGSGTDVAIESADIVLIKNDLLDAVTAIRLSKVVIRNVKENLFWAFFYNSVGIPLAAGVLYLGFNLKLNPMFAAAAMSLSSVCVVANALRLRLFKPSHKANLSPNNKANITQTNIIERRNTQMKVTIKIEGMSCGHCSARVTDALNAIEGVSASVSLEDKAAYVTSDKAIDAEVLKKAVTDAGYTVVEVI